MSNKFHRFTTKFLDEMERYFTPIMTRIGENRYMLAIRNGVVAAIPLILVGSIFMIVASFPIGENDTLNNYLTREGLTLVQTLLWLPFRATMFIMGLFVVYGTTKSLASHYKLDSMQVSFVAIVMYLISLVGPAYVPPGGPSVAFASLGSASVFGGLLISFAATEIFRLCITYNITIKLPKQVPPAVSKSFAAFIPLFFGAILATAIFGVAKFDIHSFVLSMLEPLQSFLAGNNIVGMIVLILLITLLWSAGIHGVSIIGALARPFWQLALDANTAISAVDGGGVLIYNPDNGASILPEPFYQWFVWIGGSGATLGLIISMLIVARSRYAKSMTRSAAVPSIFNINEPVIFGYPIVLNPVLIAPFILAPLVMGILSYLVMSWGWVGVPITLAAWTLPAPLGAFFATADWRAIILVFVMLAIATAIYFPFVKAYDKQLYKSEINQMEDADKAYYETLTDKKMQYKFFLLSDEHRVLFLKENKQKQMSLLSDKKLLKAYIKKLNADSDQPAASK